MTSRDRFSGVTGWAVARRAEDVAARPALVCKRQLAEELGAADASVAGCAWTVSAARLRNDFELVYRP